MNNCILKLKDIASRNKVSSLYVFGSRANEIKSLIDGYNIKKTESDSDIDIGVYYSNFYKPSMREKAQLIIELEDLFDTNKLDLVDISEAGAFLALEIINGELIYCDNSDEQAEFELYVLRKAGDLAYFERERRNIILGVG